MRTSKIEKLTTRVVLFGVMIMAVPVNVRAQTAPVATPVPAPSPVRKVTVTTANAARRVVLENKPAPPQVVTILHTLNGLKVFRLLRSKEQIEAIATLDKAFQIAGGVHTNVIAGLALDDGHTIAAWLPEAEAELPPRAIGFAPIPRAPRAPRTRAGHRPSREYEIEVPVPNVTVPAPPVPAVEVPAINFDGSLLEPADLRVITRDGKRILGRFIGLDGLTGLSLITLTNGVAAQTIDSSENTTRGWPEASRDWTATGAGSGEWRQGPDVHPHW